MKKETQEEKDLINGKASEMRKILNGIDINTAVNIVYTFQYLTLLDLPEEFKQKWLDRMKEIPINIEKYRNLKAAVPAKVDMKNN